MAACFYATHSLRGSIAQCLTSFEACDLLRSVVYLGPDGRPNRDHPRVGNCEALPTTWVMYDTNRYLSEADEYVQVIEFLVRWACACPDTACIDAALTHGRRVRDRDVELGLPDEAQAVMSRANNPQTNNTRNRIIA